MEPLPDVSDKINALHIQAKALLAQNYTEEEIIALLCREGIDVAYAKTIIGNVETEI